MCKFFEEKWFWNIAGDPCLLHPILSNKCGDRWFYSLSCPQWEKLIDCVLHGTDQRRRYGRKNHYSDAVIPENIADKIKNRPLKTNRNSLWMSLMELRQVKEVCAHVPLTYSHCFCNSTWSHDYQGRKTSFSNQFSNLMIALINTLV